MFIKKTPDNLFSSQAVRFSSPLRSATLSEFKSFRLAERLRRNAYPTSTIEQNQLLEIVSRAQTEVQNLYAEKARCDAEMGQLAIRTVVLNNQSGDIERCIRMSESLLSPFRRLPAEVLVQIFTHFCEENRIGLDSDIPGFTIAGVCAHWRAIVLSTRVVWSSMNVDLDSSRPTSKNKAAVIGLLLKRSGEYPLTITLNGAHSSKKSRVISLLNKHSHRWKSLALYIHEARLRTYMGHQIKGKLGQLEHLDLPTIRDDPMDMFEIAPRLRSLVARSLVSNIRVPLDQLVVITIGFPKISEVRNILSVCPRLENLTLLAAWDGLELDEHVHVTATSNLTELSFGIDEGRDWEAMKQLLDIMTLPCLATLIFRHHEMSLADDFWVEDWPTRQFSTFLARSGCTITSLLINSIAWLSTEALMTLLQLLPPLTTLRIHEMPKSALREILNGGSESEGSESEESDLSEDDYESGNYASVVSYTFMKTLCTHSIRDATCSPLLPSLTHLDLRLRGVMDDRTFLEMVNSRWRPYAHFTTTPSIPLPPDVDSDVDPVCCLQSLQLCLMDSALTQEARRHLGYLRNAGLSVTIEDCDAPRSYE